MVGADVRVSEPPDVLFKRFVDAVAGMVLLAMILSGRLIMTTER